jgi:WXG100 family type VII secretion target
MLEIQISYERLESAAQEFREAARLSKAVMARLDGCMTELECGWSGASRQIFFRSYLDWKSCMGGLAGLLNQIGFELSAMAEEFEKADRWAGS